MGTPPGNGLMGEYQSCCKLIVGLVQVPLNVTGAPLLQVIAWLVGFTVFVGMVVNMPIATVWVDWHPVAGSTARTVKVMG